MKSYSVAGGLSGLRSFGGPLLLSACLLTLLIATPSRRVSGQSGTTSTLWLATEIPSVPADPEVAAVELGVRFRSDVNGVIMAIRFYKAATNTGTHVGNLWTNTGSRLATVTFTNETASGWQQANFSTPIAVTADTVYVVSYHTNTGHYSDDRTTSPGTVWTIRRCTRWPTARPAPTAFTHQARRARFRRLAGTAPATGWTSCSPRPAAPPT